MEIFYAILMCIIVILAIPMALIAFCIIGTIYIVCFIVLIVGEAMENVFNFAKSIFRN